MHYKNGRLAKVGDPVIGKVSGITCAGLAVQCQPGASSCNIQVRTSTLSSPSPNTVNNYSYGVTLIVDADGKAQSVHDNTQYGNVCDFVHADDALAEVEKAIAAAVPAAS